MVREKLAEEAETVRAEGWKWVEVDTEFPYGHTFGMRWVHGGAMPMGEAGDYTFINHGGEKIGAVMNAKEKDRTPYWNFALRVGVIDTAKSAIEKAGGRVRKGPLELPDDNWLILADDCNGAKIMFTGPREKAAE